MDDNVRTSKITKVISRKFKTDVQFEMIDITVGFEEEVTWTTQEEREKKSKAITQKLVEDFNRTRDQVFQNMDIEPTDVHNYNSNAKNAVQLPKSAL